MERMKFGLHTWKYILYCMSAHSAHSEVKPHGGNKLWNQTLLQYWQSFTHSYLPGCRSIQKCVYAVKTRFEQEISIMGNIFTITVSVHRSLSVCVDFVGPERPIRDTPRNYLESFLLPKCVRICQYRYICLLFSEGHKQPEWESVCLCAQILYLTLYGFITRKVVLYCCE